MSERRYLEQEAQQHARARVALAEQFPNLDPEDPFFVESLEGLTNFPEKVDAILDHYRRLLAEAEGLKAQADAYAIPLHDRAARKEAAAQKIKERLQRVMEAIGETKINRPGGDLSLRRNGNPPVIILDEDKIPERYKIQPPVPPAKTDKAAVKEALKDPARRGELQGAATLGNAEPIMIITLK